MGTEVRSEPRRWQLPALGSRGRQATACFHDQPEREVIWHGSASRTPSRFPSNLSYSQLDDCIDLLGRLAKGVLVAARTECLDGGGPGHSARLENAVSGFGDRALDGEEPGRWSSLTRRRAMVRGGFRRLAPWRRMGSTSSGGRPS